MVREVGRALCDLRLGSLRELELIFGRRKKLEVFSRFFRMTDSRRHGAESFQVPGVKNSMTTVASNPRPGTGLQQQFSREDAPAKTSQYTLLQLINMVRDNPILYDEELQATMPDVQLKQQKRETWDRIRNDIVWQDASLIQEVWCDLLDQYSRKSLDMSDTLMDAMRWTDSLIHKKKTESRSSSQMNPIPSGLEKDFFGESTLTDDVLSGQNIASSSMKYDYVVIQPTTMGHPRTGSGSTPVQTTNQFAQRRKTPSPRETEAVVRSYPLDPPRRIVHRIPISQDTKGRQAMLVEVEPSGSYSSSTKVYKVVSSNRGSTLQVPPSRRVHQMPHASTSHGYDSMPEPLIEPANVHPEPPKKKIMVHHRNASIVGTGSSRMPLPVTNVKMIEPAISPPPTLQAEDEIIMNEDGEIKMGSSGLIMTPQQQPSSSQDHDMSRSMPSTSSDPMHHYHHQDMGDDAGLVDDINQQEVVVNEPSDMAIQYDEDLLFQQHINSVLNRLNEEDKALMKFNMQKIILDAKFGPGFARNLLKDEELLEIGEPSVEIDVDHEPNQERQI